MSSNTNRKGSRPQRRSRNPRANQMHSLVTLTKQQNDLLENLQSKEAPMSKDVIWQPISEQKVHVFVDSYLVAGGFTTNPSVAPFLAIPIRLDAGNNASAITGLFDAYRIRMVKVSFQPRALSSPISVPPLYSVLDYDDNNAISSSQAVQYSSLEVVQAGRYFERVVVPHVANAVYSGTAFTQYARAPSLTWIDTSNPSTPYYGVKVTQDPTGAGVTATQIYDITVHMKIECKNTR